MKKGDTLFWLIGILAFFAVILGGTVWIMGLAKAPDLAGLIGTLNKLVGLALFICAVIAGFIWVSSNKWIKLLRLYLKYYS